MIQFLTFRYNKQTCNKGKKVVIAITVRIGNPWINQNIVGRADITIHAQNNTFVVNSIEIFRFLINISSLNLYNLILP